MLICWPGSPGPLQNMNVSFGARLWEIAWDEAADALCFPQDSWMRGRSTDACGLNEDQVLIAAIRGPTPKIVIIRFRL